VAGKKDTEEGIMKIASEQKKKETGNYFSYSH
jgi:hypothetical protein